MIWFVLRMHAVLFTLRFPARHGKESGAAPLCVGRRGLGTSMQNLGSLASRVLPCLPLQPTPSFSISTCGVMIMKFNELNRELNGLIQHHLQRCLDGGRRYY